MKTMKTIVWFTFLLLIAASAGFSQEPISITNVQVKDGGGIDFTLTNASSRPIIGFTVEVDYVDTATGESRCKSTHVSAMGQAPSQKNSFQPEESWTESVSGCAEQGVVPTLKLDYVLFADNSEWGPDATHNSLKIKGLLQGQRLERGRLRRLLSKQGDSAMADDLRH